MDTLHSLVQCLNKEEIRFYKLYSQRYITGQDSLGNQLFDLMRKEATAYNDQNTFEKLYTAKGDKNTYYRLKNRLQHDLCDSLTMLHFDKDEANELYRYICVYNILYAKQKYELAHYFIRQAEKKAEQSNNPELLDIIYSNIVKLSNHILKINPEEYVEKQSQNALLLNRLRQMDQVLAVLNYRIKVTQNFQKGNENLLKLVDKTVKDFGRDKTISENRSFQIKIYRAISQAMVQKRRFHELEVYLLKTYDSFQHHHWLDRDTHDVHLQMLVYIINSFLMQKKFDEALQYIKTLGTEMDRYDRLLYNKYLFFYYNTQLLVYLDKDYNKALYILDEFERITRKASNSYYEQFIHLNRAILYFWTEKYSDAIRSIIKLYLNDHYKQADRSFKFKIEIAEVIMQYEAGDADTAERRIKQIKKTYTDLMKDATFAADHAVLDILQSLIAAIPAKPSTRTITKISKLIKNLAAESEVDTHIIDYARWLAPKAGIDLKALSAH
ncbi:MAG: hypothetical protein JST83_08005 [Bacteroidetes bacterium]|nr:hypothetical protein [Bacteroidota bacterium]